MSTKENVTIEKIGNGKYIATASDDNGNWSSSTWCTNPETAKSEALTALQYGFFGTFLQSTENKEVSCDNHYYNEGCVTQSEPHTEEKAYSGVFVEGWIIAAFLIAGIVFFILNPV